MATGITGTRTIEPVNRTGSFSTSAFDFLKIGIREIAPSSLDRLSISANKRVDNVREFFCKSFEPPDLWPRSFVQLKLEL